MDTQRISRWIGSVIGAALMVVGAIAIAAPVAAAGDRQAPPAEQGTTPSPKVSASLAAAQQSGGGPGPGRGFGRGGLNVGPGIFGADLDDAQREQIKAIRDRHAEAIRPLAERAQAAHKALADATLANPVDVNQLRIAANELGAAEGELAFARAQVEVEVLSVLTSAQREQMAARQKEMEQRRSQGRRGRQ